MSSSRLQVVIVVLLLLTVGPISAVGTVSAAKGGTISDVYVFGMTDADGDGKYSSMDIDIFADTRVGQFGDLSTNPYFKIYVNDQLVRTTTVVATEETGIFEYSLSKEELAGLSAGQADVRVELWEGDSATSDDYFATWDPSEEDISFEPESKDYTIRDRGLKGIRKLDGSYDAASKRLSYDYLADKQLDYALSAFGALVPTSDREAELEIAITAIDDVAGTSAGSIGTTLLAAPQVGVNVGASLQAGKLANTLSKTDYSTRSNFHLYLDKLKQNTQSVVDSSDPSDSTLEERLSTIKTVYKKSIKYQSEVRNTYTDNQQYHFDIIVDLWGADRESYETVKGNFEQLQQSLIADYYFTQLALHPNQTPTNLTSKVGYTEPEYPDADITDVSYPDTVRVGETVTVTMTAETKYAETPSQTFTIGFPDDGRVSDVSIDSHTLPDASYAKVFDSGSQLWGGYGEAEKTVGYPVVEAADRLSSGSSHSITVTFTPTESGDVRLWAKSIAWADNSQGSLNPDPGWEEADNSGVVKDGQDEYAYQHVITVKPADSDDDGLTDPNDPCPNDPNCDDTGKNDKNDQKPTDPNNDGDGWIDGADPNPNDANSDGTWKQDGVGAENKNDIDGDGTRNFADADNDGDGLTDGAEVDQYGTDPTKSDTDGDGLDDAAEVNQHGTDPTTADTDGDGYDDSAEISAGTDPTDPNDYPTDPQPPTADAGGPYTVTVGDTVTLDASGSSDPDGSIQSTAWTVVSGPGSVSGDTYQAPGSVESETNATVEVTVTDDSGMTATDRTNVTVSPAGSGTATFEVSVTGTNGPVTAGSRIEVSAEVTNVGDAAGSTTVRLLGPEEAALDSTSVTLSTGETTQTTLTWSSGSGTAGEISLDVQTDDEVETTTVTVEDDSSDGGSDAVATTGSVSVSQDSVDQWHQVSLDATVDNPVVVMGPVSSNGPHPVHTRVRNVDSTSFEFKLEEWAYKDGSHKTETVSYLVVEEGAHSVGDLTLDAGTVSATTEFTTASLDAQFGSPPVVVSQTQTVNEADPVVTRQSNVTTGSVDLRLQESEAGGTHASETVGYVALSRTTDTLDGTAVEVGQTGDVVEEYSHRIGFDATTTDGSVFLARAQTFDGSDTINLRYDDLTAAGVDVQLEEEESNDYETSHTTENVGWVVFDDPITVGSDGSGGDGSPPSASFSYSPSDPTTGEQVDFDASATTDPDGDVVAYRWDVDGDGTVEATGEQAAHTYDSAGTYEATLTVEDAVGHTNTTRETVTVGPASLVIDEVTVDGQSVSSVPAATDTNLTVTLSIDGNDGPRAYNSGRVTVSQDGVQLGVVDARTGSVNDGQYRFTGLEVGDSDAPLVVNASRYADLDGDQALEPSEIVATSERTIEVTGDTPANDGYVYRLPFVRNEGALSDAWSSQLRVTAPPNSTTVSVDTDADGQTETTTTIAAGETETFATPSAGAVVEASRRVTVQYNYGAANFGAYEDGRQAYGVPETSLLGTEYYVPIETDTLAVAATAATSVRLDVDGDGTADRSRSVTADGVATFSDVPAGAHLLAEAPVGVVAERSNWGGMDDTLATSLLPVETARQTYETPAEPSYSRESPTSHSGVTLVGTRDGTSVGVDLGRTGENDSRLQLDAGAVETVATTERAAIRADAPVIAVYTFHVTARDPWTGDRRDYVGSLTPVESTNFKQGSWSGTSEHVEAWSSYQITARDDDGTEEPSPPENDGAEPNDSPSMATPLARNDTRAGLQIVGNESDYYAVTLSEGDRFEATLTTDQEGADLEATILGPELATVAESASGTDGTIASTTATTAGTYYVHVRSPSGQSAPYTLNVSTTSTAVDGGQTVDVTPDAETIGIGESTTFTVSLDASNGLQGQQFQLDLTDGTVADITSVELPGDPPLRTVTIGQHNDSAYVEAGYLPPREGPAPLVMATVTVEATARGSTGVTVSDVTATDRDNDQYSISETGDGTLTVSTAMPTLPDQASPAKDPDGDALLEDVTGDGRTNLFDALAYYNARDTDAVQNNPRRFDFDGDGRAGTLFDALELYNEIQPR